VENGVTNWIKFIHYDENNKRMYYIKITKEALGSSVIYAQNNTSHYITPSGSETRYLFKKKYFQQTQNLSISNAYILLDYYFIDKTLWKKFEQNREQVISVTQYTNDKMIYHTQSTVHVDHANPCSLLLINTIQEYNMGGFMYDYFNYSNDPTGTVNNILKMGLYLMKQERTKYNDFRYFNELEPQKWLKKGVGNGIGFYSFCLKPFSPDITGNCNLTVLKDLEIKLQMNNNVTINRPLKIRIYTMAYRNLKYENGYVVIE
jgi:hypothetical protein